MPRMLLILFLLVLIPGTGSAQGPVVALKELEREALSNNPDVLMAARNAEAAEKRVTVASALPDPMIGYEVQSVGEFGKSTVGREEMSMRGLVVSQEIPFPGKRSTMGRAAEKAAGREQEALREVKLRILNAVRAAYYNYYLAYRSAEILEQNKEIMKNFQRIAETRYATGQGIQQDVLRAQLEVSMLLEKLAMEEQKKEAQRTMINSLLGRNPLASLAKPGDRLPTVFQASLEDLAERAVSHAPAVLAGQKMVEMNEAELRLSRLEFLPDFTVTAGRFERGDMPDFWQASVMLKVPLWFWNKSAAVKESAAELGASRHEYEARRLMVISKVKDQYTMAKTSEQLLNLYESGILPQARLALQSATSNYQVGKIDFLSLLESQSVLLRYQLQYENELVNLNKTISMISEVTGEGVSIHEK